MKRKNEAGRQTTMAEPNHKQHSEGFATEYKMNGHNGGVEETDIDAAMEESKNHTPGKMCYKMINISFLQ